MSTFTDWNGPQCPPPSTKSILDLVQAYNNMYQSLSQHVAMTPSDAGDVHGIKAYVSSVLGDYAKTAALSGTYATIDALNTKASQQAFGEHVAAQANATASPHGIANYVGQQLANYYTKPEANSTFTSKGELTNHENRTAEGDVHGVKSYIQSIIAAYTPTATLETNYVKKGGSDQENTFFWHVNMNADQTHDPHQIKNYIAGVLSRYDTSDAAETKFANKQAFTTHIEAEVTVNGDDVHGIKDYVAAVLTDYDTHDQIAQNYYNKTEADQQFVSRENEQFDIISAETFKTIPLTIPQGNAKYIGVNNGRVYYVLGELTEKTGTAFITYDNTANMAMIVNFARSGSDTAILDATITREPGVWIDTQIAICKATDANQQPRYYLCLSKVGMTDHLNFTPAVTGINILSSEQVNFTAPVSNGEAHLLAKVDFSNHVPNQHISSEDESDGIPVGAGIRWPIIIDPSTGNPTNIPEGYLPADGRTVTKQHYPQLAEAWGITNDDFIIPAEDNTIFKCIR